MGATLLTYGQVFLVTSGKELEDMMELWYYTLRNNGLLS